MARFISDFFVKDSISPLPTSPKVYGIFSGMPGILLCVRKAPDKYTLAIRSLREGVG
jgi:hypothetical protein